MENLLNEKETGGLGMEMAEMRTDITALKILRLPNIERGAAAAYR